ncbi:MAG TPA: ribonuclease III [Prolixibacteraceae bacterium]|nr:ribonuclease III [Prolixibacteraceae bacterium]
MIRNLIYKIKLFSSPRKEFYSYIRNLTGHCPLKFKLYDIAFIHKSASYVDKMGNVVNNERLEYLGDAVLGTIVAEYLYNRFPSKDEGFLTQLRSRVVNRSFLTQLTFKMGLNKYVVSNASSVSESSHLYGDLLEAFIGAIYLDSGYAVTKQFVIKKVFNQHVDIREMEKVDNNFKSQLIEWGQKIKQEVEFKTVNNPDSGSEKMPFISEAYIDGKVMGTGEGYSKKEAQQNAAQHALGKLSAEESL